MKKYILISLAALVALACSVDEATSVISEPAVPEGPLSLTFQAGVESVLVKTGVSNGSGNNKTVSWETGDEITIIWGTEASQRTTAQAGSSGASTQFAASVEDAPVYYAVYPSSVSATLDGSGNLSLAIPSETDGSFASASIMVAKTTREACDFAFKNLGGIIKFTVAGSGIGSVEVRGIKGESLAGEASYSLDSDGIPVQGSLVAGESRLKVNLSGAGTYYAPVFGGVSLPSGIVFRLKSGDVYLPATGSSSAFSAARAEIVAIGGNLDETVVTDYFVKTDGSASASGRNWENALNAAGLCALLEKSSDEDLNLARAWKMDGTTIHMASGTYLVEGSGGSELEIDYVEADEPVHISLLGGYPAGLSGTSVSGRDAVLNGTVLSGDDAHPMFVFHDMVDFAFDGCTLSGAMLPASAQGASAKGRGAIYINPDTAEDVSVKTENGLKTIIRANSCRFAGNTALGSNAGSANAYDGGAAVHIVRGQFYGDNCVFSGNTARFRGAAIRVNAGLSILFLNRCLFTGNHLKNNFGTALALNDGHLVMNNCTVYGNAGDTASDTAVDITQGSPFILNSTLIESTSSAAVLRLDGALGAAQMPTIMNNVIINGTSANNSVIINTQNTFLVSKGHNIVGKAGGGGNSKFTRDATDSFANELSALGDASYDAATGQYVWDGTGTLESFTYATAAEEEDVIRNYYKPTRYPDLGETFWTWVNAEGRGGIAVDKAGNSRSSDKLIPGSYQK